MISARAPGLRWLLYLAAGFVLLQLISWKGKRHTVGGIEVPEDI